MKAFDFRLEKVLRWRETQLHLHKSRVAAATAEVVRIQGAIEMLAAECVKSAGLIALDPAAVVFTAYAGFVDRSRARTRQLKDQLAKAKRNLAAETDRLAEVNRKLRLLENLKSGQHDEWQREFDREIAAFADETFLGRLQSKKQPGA